jgi:universal bacterial protein YeaZ
MRILGIETSSLVASVAIVTDDILTAEYTVNLKKTHSQTLLPMINEIFKMLEIELDTIDAIAISAGPGSFTGLRIGSATAKGLGFALNKPLINIPTVDAMAYGIFKTKSLICPLMDARRNQVYTGIYENLSEFKIIEPQCAISIEEIISKLNELNNDVIFLGDGTPVAKELIETTLKVPYTYAPAYCNRQRAAAVATLGAEYFKNGKVETAAEHTPNYLRVSQAERERAEKEIRNQDRT